MTAADISGTGFDQAGLRDGFEIVEEYIQHGEHGLAFEHVDYMVTETEIALTPDSARVLEEIAISYGFPTARVRVAP